MTFLARVASIGPNPNARIHLLELSWMEDGWKTLPDRNCQNKIVVIGYRPNFFRKMHEIIDTQITSKVEPTVFCKVACFFESFSETFALTGVEINLLSSWSRGTSAPVLSIRQWTHFSFLPFRKVVAHCALGFAWILVPVLERWCHSKPCYGARSVPVFGTWLFWWKT
jgi:hypothetical protein